jgi:NAD(P)-dependent dehydrogenase (short-subunit alcohol dehydrogenase family)
MKKAALVTGGAVRIGKEISLNLAQKGYNIALHYNSSEKEALATRELILKSDVKCDLFRCDLSSLDSARELVPEVMESLGELCVLVNNASIFENVGFHDVTPEFLETDMAINFKAPFFLSQSFSTETSGGLIVNFLDTRIRKNPVEHFSYNLSKKCLYHLTKMLARELAPDFRVNALCPGAVLAPPGFGDDYLHRMVQGAPMKRPGSIEDIINAFNYLLENNYVTGECLFVDGGMSLT